MNNGRTKETRGAYHPETPAPGNQPPYYENISRGHDPGRSRGSKAAQKPHRSRTANRRRTEENRGGIDPGPEPFDLPAVTTQIFSRRLRTRDEHRRTGTTNHGGSTGNRREAGHSWPRSTPKTSRKRETKQRDEQQKNNGKEGGSTGQHEQAANRRKRS